MPDVPDIYYSEEFNIETKYLKQPVRFEKLEQVVIVSAWGVRFGIKIFLILHL